MTDAFVQIQVDGAGKFVDTTSLTVASTLVQRQRFVVAGAGASDLAPVDAIQGLATAIKDIPVVLRQIVSQINRPIAMDPGTGRLRSSIDNIASGLTLSTITTVGIVSTVSSVTSVSTVNTVTTVTTVATVTAVTSLNQLRGFDIKDTFMNSIDRTLWGQNIRPRISG